MNKRPKIKVISDAVCGILMLVCLLTYLLIGAIAKVWHPTWIIIVVGAFVSGIVGIVADTVVGIKKADSYEDTQNK